jgi:hypothetical protein
MTSSSLLSARDPVLLGSESANLDQNPVVSIAL